MKNPEAEDGIQYPEQYELYANRPNDRSLSRRNFFKYVGGGIASFLVFTDVLAAQVVDQMNAKEKRIAEDTIAAWIHIDEEGKITVFTGKVEVGQNIRTSLSQIVEEEIFVQIDSIEL